MLTGRVVLTVHHHLERDSGAAGSFLATKEAMEARGHSTTILSFDDLPRSLPAQALQIAFPWFVAARLRTLCDAEQVAAVIASTGDTWLWSRWIARENPPPIVVRSTGLEHQAHAARLRNARATGAPMSRRYPLYHGGFRLREVAASLRHADAVAFLNEGDRTFATTQLGVASAKARVVGQGIETSVLATARAERIPDDAPLHLVWIGTFSARKGSESAVPAVTTFLERHPGSTIRFLGAGVPPTQVYDAFAPSVRDRVVVTARFTNAELPQLTSGATVLVFPSLYEGFGKALAEGMACGLAAVVAQNAGTSSIVTDGVDGLMHPAGDSRALLAALERLDSDRDLLHRLRRAGQESVQRFRWSHVADELLDAADEAVERRTP